LPQPSDARTAAVGSSPVSSSVYRSLETMLASPAVPQHDAVSLQPLCELAEDAAVAAAA
jgi:hypothetical protein